MSQLLTMKINFLKKLLLLFAALFSCNLSADTPVTLFESHAGNINFIGAQATRRTQSNAGNACAVLGVNTTNSAVVTGIPTGATIRAAHLYWAGSGSTPDYTVNFEGGTVTAPVNRRYTADYISTYFFFSGVADVTTQVSAKGNGTYSFSGLTVDTGNPYCPVEGVLAGWSLLIFYESPVEDYRVINLYEGFQAFRNSSITLNPSNFRVPATVNGKYAALTWDGDNTLNSTNENLVFNGSPLSDANNPVGAQFNSISNIASIAPSTGSVDNNSYGVDFDSFNINSLLNPGDTSATATYSSGSDLVLLSSQIISVTNTPVSDLGISKTATSSFNVGSNATYQLSVNNAGPNIEPGNIVVTDTLPAGLTFVSATGTGWSCGAVSQTVTCTRSGSLAVGATAAPITLTVAVGSAASPSVSNTASVSGTNFDNVSGNNNSTINTTVTSAPTITLQKLSRTISDPVNGTANPKAIPGALSEYTIQATNSGLTAADNNSIAITDSIPANTALYVGDISGAGSGPIRFVDGTPPSGLAYNFVNLASTTDNVSFSNNGGTSFNYTPSPDAEGVDTNVTHIQVTTTGQFLAASGSGDPSFVILFRVKVQ